MPQLSLYLDEPTMEMLREKSSRAHQSMSRYVTGLIRESGEGRGWPSGYWDNVYGCLDVYKRQAPAWATAWPCTSRVTAARRTSPGAVSPTRWHRSFPWRDVYKRQLLWRAGGVRAFSAGNAC